MVLKYFNNYKTCLKYNKQYNRKEYIRSGEFGNQFNISQNLIANTSSSVFIKKRTKKKIKRFVFNKLIRFNKFPIKHMVPHKYFKCIGFLYLTHP